MRRRADWRSRLIATIEGYRRLPFSWAENNCGFFAATCVEAMTDVDLAAHFRGQFADAAGAGRVLAATGFATLADLAAVYLPEIAPVLLREGDVAAFDDGRLWALGIATGERITVLREDGLGTMARTAVQRGFRVP
jgi:hypothetical protein